MIEQIFVSTAGLLILAGTQNNEENVEIETQRVTFEARISKCST